MGKTLLEWGHQRALITGASSGIGLAIAHALSDEGIAVIGLSRGAPAVPPARYTHLSVDLADRGAVETALAEIAREPPDIWINNAGLGLLGGAWSPDDDQIERLLEVMLAVPIRLTRFFAEQCRSRPQQPAYLVQVSSLAVELPIPDMPYYNAAKSGLSGFASSLLLDKDCPFRVIDFRPGDYNTPFISNETIQDTVTDPVLFETLLKHHRRAPEPEAAANALLRAMRSQRQGIIRCGNFFQAKVAPLGNKLLPQHMLMRVIRRYYNVRRPPL